MVRYYSAKLTTLVKSYHIRSICVCVEWQSTHAGRCLSRIPLIPLISHLFSSSFYRSFPSLLFWQNSPESTEEKIPGVYGVYREGGSGGGWMQEEEVVEILRTEVFVERGNRRRVSLIFARLSLTSTFLLVTLFPYPSILFHKYARSPLILLTDGSFNSSRRTNSILSFEKYVQIWRYE